VDAERAQLVQPLDGGLVEHQHGLGQLQDQVGGGQPGGVDGAGHVLDHVGLLELAHREVDADERRPHQREAALPVAGRPAGRVQHPAADGDDQAALLGHADELAGHHQAPFGVVPAHQRLQPHHAAAGQLDHRLVADRELLLQHRRARGSLEVQPQQRARAWRRRTAGPCRGRSAWRRTSPGRRRAAARRGRRRCGAGHRLPQPLQEPRPVGQPGERVDGGARGQLGGEGGPVQGQRPLPGDGLLLAAEDAAEQVGERGDDGEAGDLRGHLGEQRRAVGARSQRRGRGPPAEAQRRRQRPAGRAADRGHEREQGHGGQPDRGRASLATAATVRATRRRAGEGSRTLAPHRPGGPSRPWHGLL
jgi:hypothetical protein